MKYAIFVATCTWLVACSVSNVSLVKAQDAGTVESPSSTYGTTYGGADTTGSSSTTYGTAGTANTYGTAPADASPAAAPPPPPPEASKRDRSVYYKKVRGFLWLEAIAGVSSFDPDQFGSFNISAGSVPNAPKVTGPEFGGMAALGLGGFILGASYRQANYDVYKLMKVGVDIQGVFRFIPYVHPMVRLNLFYARTFDGSPYGLSDPASDGGGFTAGAGIRVPIIRWMSFSATFDWSFIALSERGNLSDGTRVANTVSGQQLGGTFALTFHFIGVRKK